MALTSRHGEFWAHEGPHLSGEGRSPMPARRSSLSPEGRPAAAMVIAAAAASRADTPYHPHPPHRPSTAPVAGKSRTPQHQGEAEPTFKYI